MFKDNWLFFYGNLISMGIKACSWENSTFYGEKHNSSIWTGCQNYAIFSMEQKEQIQRPVHTRFPYIYSAFLHNKCQIIDQHLYRNSSQELGEKSSTPLCAYNLADLILKIIFLKQSFTCGPHTTYAHPWWPEKHEFVWAARF